jgi:hypothetical protein
MRPDLGRNAATARRMSSGRAYNCAGADMDIADSCCVVVTYKYVVCHFGIEHSEVTEGGVVKGWGW